MKHSSEYRSTSAALQDNLKSACQDFTWPDLTHNNYISFILTQDLLDRLVQQETVDLQDHRELQVNQAMLGLPDQLETKAIQVQRDRQDNQDLRVNLGQLVLVAHLETVAQQERQDLKVSSSNLIANKI